MSIKAIPTLLLESVTSIPASHAASLGVHRKKNKKKTGGQRIS